MGFFELQVVAECEVPDIVYSGDTGFGDLLISESAEADLLIHECTSLETLPGHTSHA